MKKAKQVKSAKKGTSKRVVKPLQRGMAVKKTKPDNLVKEAKSIAKRLGYSC